MCAELASHRFAEFAGLSLFAIHIDMLASYDAAKREVMPSVEHRQHKGLNNRALGSVSP